MTTHAQRRPLVPASALLLVLSLAATGLAKPARAQDNPEQTESLGSPLMAAAPLTTSEALAALPEAEGYTLLITDPRLSPQQQEDLGALLIDVIGEAHFFGAIYAYLPDGSTELSLHLRRGLHSPEVAETSALADCEAERRADDSPCQAVGQIIPENWDPDEPLHLSHDAIYGFRQTAGQLEKPKVLARSRNTTSWSMWAGPDVRQQALDECNEAVVAGGFAADCEVVIEDPAEEASQGAGTVAAE
jgi:hypothetical protein